MIAKGESVADILNFFKKYIQVHSLYGDFIFTFPSISVLPFCIPFLFQIIKQQRASGNPGWGFPEFNRP